MPTAAECLTRVLLLSSEMIELAREGDESGGDTGPRTVFANLRDCGYKLKLLAEAELAEEPLQVAESAQPKRVLIADDDADTVTYLRTWFEDSGFMTSTALDGAEAMKAIESERPDLVTLDMSMPEKSGVKVYARLKGDASLRRIPVIIISGIGEPMHLFLKGRSQVPAPEGFLPKPIDIRALGTMVKRLVG